MNFNFRLLIILFTTLTTSHAYADKGFCNYCSIKSIHFGAYSSKQCNGASSCAEVRFKAQHLGFKTALCSNKLPFQFIVDTSTTNGQLLLAKLLKAYRNHETLNLNGAGKCTYMFGSENLASAHTSKKQNEEQP